MKEIIATDNRYAQFIHPYIGGDEFLNDPRQLHRRYVIDFCDYLKKRRDNGRC